MSGIKNTMIEIEVNNNELEAVLYETLKPIIRNFNNHFGTKVEIERVDLEISKVNKLLWGQESKEKMWQKILDLIKSQKIKNMFLESEAFLSMLTFEFIEVGLKNDLYYSTFVTSWGIKDTLLKSVEKITGGIVPTLGVRFKVLTNNETLSKSGFA